MESRSNNNSTSSSPDNQTQHEMSPQEMQKGIENQERSLQSVCLAPSSNIFTSNKINTQNKEECIETSKEQKGQRCGKGHPCQKEIKFLTKKIEKLENDKDTMIDNFQLSSSVLLERIKDLEAQISFGERPQTANVLSKISAESNGKRIGASNVSNKKASVRKEREDVEKDENEIVQCPNCKDEFTSGTMATHTVQCYRDATKCRVCGEVIQRDKKKEHLSRWRDQKKLIEAICEDNDEELGIYFDHGMDVNLIFNNDAEGWTPMHYAAKHNSIKTLIALISRGAGVDPPDNQLKTPLMVANENNKTAVARSLIELGADIEIRDNRQKTPLMYACKSGDTEIVELLIANKVDVKATSSLGDSAVQMAQKSGNSEVVMLLVKCGASIRPGSRQRR